MKANTKERQINNAASFFRDNFIVSEKEATKIGKDFQQKLAKQLENKYISRNANKEQISFSTNFKRVLRANYLMFAAITNVILIIILFTFAFLNDRADQDNVTDQKLIATITYTEGNVKTSIDEHNWNKVIESTNINEGETIKVSNSARAIVTLTDGSIIRLNSASSLNIEKLTNDHIILNNTKGEVYFRIAKSDRIFDVMVDDNLVTSLGTSFKTFNYINKKGVDVYQSKVSAFDSDVAADLLVSEGNRYYFNNYSHKNAKTILALNIEQISTDDFITWNKSLDESIIDYEDKLGILKDINLPGLTISSPKRQIFETTDDTLILSGFTDSAARVTINNSLIKTNAGEFKHIYKLESGLNIIVIKSKSETGSITKKVLKITLKAAEEEDSTNNGSIYLNIDKGDSGLRFNWATNGNLDLSRGFRIIKDRQGHYPTLPGIGYRTVNSSQRSYTWTLQSGKKYSFRICQLVSSSSCGIYSNTITIKEPIGYTEPTATPTSTTVPTPTSTPIPYVANINAIGMCGSKVNWSVNGYSQYGFNVVWDTSPNPSCNDGQKLVYTDPKTTLSSALSAFNSAGNYYVIVYERNKSTSCGVASNQIVLNLH